MLSGMDAISAIVAAGSTTIVSAADGVTIGAVRRLTTARIESRRGNMIQIFTGFHGIYCIPRKDHQALTFSSGDVV
ncbi:hypothetical protein [Mesorhizobium sp.]|uniref:hypothetical protein n=1 Tax=Mesorhizobium sp. TaxID=1871066 RepID=UPI0025E1055D|nr:hypothetical protein [Mesorhizobium sp.]